MGILKICGVIDVAITRDEDKAGLNRIDTSGMTDMSSMFACADILNNGINP